MQFKQELSSSSWNRRPFGHNRHGPKRHGSCCVPFGGGDEGGTGFHLTQCGQGRGLPPYQVASWSNQPFGHNKHGSKSGVAVPLFRHLTECCLGWDLPPYHVASWCIQPFGHNRHGPKIGGCAPLVELGPHLTQCGQSWSLPPYQVASWSIQPLATTDTGREFGGAGRCSTLFFLGGGSWVPI